MDFAMTKSPTSGQTSGATGSGALLRSDAFLSPLAIGAAVTRALDEDLGRAGDITSIATIPEDRAGRAVVVARQTGVIAGLPLVVAAFRRLAPDMTIVPHARDGENVARGAELMTISGNARAILGAERVALNFLGHLSGIATATAAFVLRIAHTKARIICTRKTTPGLRALEKYAVRCGGGYNHRFGLDDAILIKDNHIAVAGGIRPVLERAKGAAGHLVKIEIEVDSLEQLKEVLDVGLADVVLIDNFDLAALRKAVAMAAGHVVIEASGGITLESAAAIAETGVDYLSSGALTHSVQNLDVGLDIAM
jgi:nicotinate-nucleotide pyrophosphorylase (carboxylating)